MIARGNALTSVGGGPVESFETFRPYLFAIAYRMLGSAMDAEDSVRFYSLRLQEAGMIKSSPQKIMAQGTDWRFFRELKKELKA